MNLLNRLTYKNLKLNKKRTIVTIIGIILSVALITAVASMFFSARSSLIKFEIRQKGNYHYAFKNVPESDVKYFRENRNFENLYFMKGIGYAELKESKNLYKPYVYVLGLDDSAIEESGVKLVSGRLPENETEILIPTHLKTNGRVNYKVGDTLTFEVGKRMVLEEDEEEYFELYQNNPYNPDVYEEIIQDKKTMTFTIVGVMERLSNSVEPYVAPGFTFVTKIDDKSLSGNNLSIYARYTKEALKEEAAVTADILSADREAFKYLYYSNLDFDEKKALEYKEKLGELKYQFESNNYLIELESGILGDSMSQALGIVVVIVVSIIIFTSVFCIKNSFNISITEKTKQYGMLSTVGATSKQIKRNVYTEAFMLGIIGVPLGILCGLLASYILIMISNLLIGDMLGFDLVFSFSWISIVFAIVLGFVTLYLSAWGSAHKAAKISPITAIRNSEDIKINSKKVKSPKYIKKIFGVGGDISYKNLRRNKKKYRATVISIVVCVSIFIALASFIDLAFRSIQNEFDTTDYNISLSYRHDKISKFQDKAHSVLNLDNIEDYSIISNANIFLENNLVKFSKEYLKYYPDIQEYLDGEDEDGNPIKVMNNTYITVYRVGDHAYRAYLDELGLNYEDVKDKGILIDDTDVWVPKDGKNDDYEKLTIPYLDYKKGDVLNWKKNINEVDENGKWKTEDVNIEIALETNKNPFGLKSKGNGAQIVLSDELFNEIFEDELEDIYETIVIYSNNATKLQDDIDSLLGDEESYTLANTEESVKMMRSFYTLVSIFLYGFITVIALIGITNIFNTITTNMELRSREFATLKSVGMTKKEFNRMIRLESFFYGTKSLIVGIPIGCVLSYVIYHFLTDGNSSIRYELPIMAILISVLAVFILISCIMKYSIGKINKQNTIETIRNENI